MLSVGDIFKKYRENKKLKLSDVEKQIRIREKYLYALEQNSWEMFPSKIYIVGIITTYAKFLGIDKKKALAFFRRDYERQEEVKFKEKVAKDYLKPDTKKARIFIGSVIVTVFLIYFSYQLKTYFSPPTLTFIEPTKTVFNRREKQILIKGKIDKEATIEIADERVYPNKEGIFEYRVTLKEGKNVFQIELTGANGKKRTITKEYILKK